MRVWYCTLVLNEALLFCTRRCDGVLSIISYNWSIFVSNGWLVSSNQSNSVVCSIRDESVEYLRNCSHMCRACLYRVQKERLCLICSYLMKKWGLHSYKYQKNMSLKILFLTGTSLQRHTYPCDKWLYCSMKTCSDWFIVYFSLDKDPMVFGFRIWLALLVAKDFYLIVEFP